MYCSTQLAVALLVFLARTARARLVSADLARIAYKRRVLLRGLLRGWRGTAGRSRLSASVDFTGIDDPYEEPVNAEITLNTVDTTPEELARQIIGYLQEEGFIN